MITAIILDSGPLSSLTQRQGVKSADDCRAWVAARLQQNVRFFVPEIIEYELRRELIRAGKSASLARLDLFIHSVSDRLITLNSAALRLAAELWAKIRQSGQPTGDPNHLDIDVILAAQALTMGVPTGQFVVATSNVKHLSRLVAASEWETL